MELCKVGCKNAKKKNTKKNTFFTRNLSIVLLRACSRSYVSRTTIVYVSVLRHWVNQYQTKSDRLFKSKPFMLYISAAAFFLHFLLTFLLLALDGGLWKPTIELHVINWTLARSKLYLSKFESIIGWKWWLIVIFGWTKWSLSMYCCSFNLNCDFFKTRN